MTGELRRAPALCAGDTIAFVAPASGLAAAVPHRLEKAKQTLEGYGFQVKIYASVTRTAKENMQTLIDEQAALGSPLDRTIYDPETVQSYSSADAITRAQEFMDAFQDPNVKAIVSTIGGLTCHEMLEYLDFDIIRQNPKIVCGFSDITTLHFALYAKAQLVSFYGPSALCQFGEFPAPLDFTMTHFWKAVQSPDPIGAVQPSKEWTDDKTANWFTRADMTYQDRMRPNTPAYLWLRPGAATGRLLGGCLPVFLNVRGTEYMPVLDDCVLLLETCEGRVFDQGMDMDHVNLVLGCLRMDGTFRRIRGLVIGRAFAYSEDQVRELQRLVLYHTRGTSFPILYGLDCGHTNPVLTLPLGCEVEICSQENRFAILQSGVA